MKSTRVLCQTVNILLIMGWLTTVSHVFDTFWLELTQASIALHRLSYRRWLTALNCAFQQWKELASGPIFNWFTFPAALVNFGEGVHWVEWQWEWEEKEKKAKWPKWTQLRLSFAFYSAWFMSPGASLTASRFCSLLQEKPSHSNQELEFISTQAPFYPIEATEKGATASQYGLVTNIFMHNLKMMICFKSKNLI